MEQGGEWVCWIISELQLTGIQEDKWFQPAKSNANHAKNKRII